MSLLYQSIDFWKCSTSNEARILLVLCKQKRKADERPANGRILSREIYLRMTILSYGEIAINLPLSVLLFLLDLVDPIPSSFWPGWANIHRDFSRIPVTMASEWQTDIWQILFIKWDLWMSAITAIIFFVFFGSTQESRTVYSSIYRTVSAKIGFRQSVVCNQPVETRNIGRDTVQSIPV